MKRLAIFIGGLLVLPAFAEVAPVFYDEIEYSDVMYDENGEPIYDQEDDLPSTVNAGSNVDKPSVAGVRNVSATRSNTNRTTIGRTVPTTTANAATGRGNASNSSRAVAARTTTNSSPRSASNTGSRSVTSRGTTSRTTSTAATRTTSNVAATAAAATRATGGAGRSSSTSRTASTGSGTVARTTTTSRTGTSSRVATTGARVNRAATNAAVSVNSNKVMSVAGVSGTTGNRVMSIGNDSGSLYNANTARVSVRGSASRTPTIRMASTTGLSTDSVSVTAADLADMDELAEMTDYCKAQYAACMDNYCNVLDDNQGRCSCSANIKNYAKAEAALKSATEELQEVAQKIQYIGLSAREVETLFTQTEAELKMQSTADTSQLKTSLDKVRDMIIEVQSGNASSSASSSLSFDLSGLLDFTIDSTGFDLSSFLGGFGTNTSEVSNQRGAELFKTATNRCKTNVLRACTANGVDASLITNAYDLEIDRECIAYERSLNDSNDQMVATVRNAKSVLQRARLLVEQSKNEYDMRECINALDSCMQDEYVCGSDYEKCLDPSGRYIVNGEIVIGSDPGRAVNGIGDGSTGVLNGDVCSMNLYNVWNYGGSTAGQTNTSQSGCTNAWNSYSLGGSGNGDLAGYIDATLGLHTGLGMSEYIQAKIGWKGTGNDSDKNYGMCMSVLNKCQDYTYTGNGSSRKYKPDNEVVKQYLNRILVQIKAKQDQILADHAESCITDVTTCLSQNDYPFDEENVTANSVKANIAINACRSTIVTCMSVNGYSVDDPTPSDLWPWICGITTGSTNCTGGNSGGGSGGGNGGGGDEQTYTHTITYSCNNETNTTWTQTVSGTSNTMSVAFATKSTVTSHCPYSDYTATNFSCRFAGYTNGIEIGFGQSDYRINNDVICTVLWTPNENNHTCSPSNLSYCTENNCASTGQGVWCYTSSSPTSSPSCVASSAASLSCKCHANDLGRCDGPAACKGLGSSYNWCVTGSSAKAQCYTAGDTPSNACCFGVENNNCTSATCDMVGNTWCPSETPQCRMGSILPDGTIGHVECGGTGGGANYNRRLNLSR